MLQQSPPGALLVNGEVTAVLASLRSTSRWISSSTRNEVKSCLASIRPRVCANDASSQVGVSFSHLYAG